jgi:hypothetical protein
LHVRCSGAMDLDHSHGYFVRPKIRFYNGIGALSSRTWSCLHIVSNQQLNPTVGWYQRKLLSLSNWRLGVYNDAEHLNNGDLVSIMMLSTIKLETWCLLNDAEQHNKWRLGAQLFWYWANNNFSYICHWIGGASMSMTPHARSMRGGNILMWLCVTAKWSVLTNKCWTVL